MKTTIEEINGEKFTVVIHNEKLWSGYKTRKNQKMDFKLVENNQGFSLNIAAITIATILKPLPRHPKPDDARLLYRYMAEGIRPFAIAQTPKGLPLGSWCGMGVLEAAEASRNMEIKYGFNDADEKIEVAIEDNQNEN